MKIDKLIEISKDYYNYPLAKLVHKYTKDDVTFITEYYKNTNLKSIKLYDFYDNKLLYNDLYEIKKDFFQNLTNKHIHSNSYYKNSLIQEIKATLSIENIGSTRKEISELIEGKIPNNEDQKKLKGIIDGYKYIANINNKITTENIAKLYKIAIVKTLSENDYLKNKYMYRNDKIYVGKSHEGINYIKIEKAVNNLVNYINTKDNTNELTKASIIHFYFSYIHPYFDGNGRMSRLLHIWYLIQNGFDATLQISISKLIENSKKEYYKAFDEIEDDFEYSKIIDCTKFINYMYTHVYSKIIKNETNITSYLKLLKSGAITEKENKLWNFVCENYYGSYFSTKQLEKDYKDISYETVRKFVTKFEEHGLLTKIIVGSRNKYIISDT